jgi:hypothetical protein
LKPSPHVRAAIDPATTPAVKISVDIVGME